MYIQIIGLNRFDFLDLCNDLGEGWYKSVEEIDDLEEVNVSIDTEVVILKINDKIWLHMGDKIAEIEADHFQKIVIL